MHPLFWRCVSGCLGVGGHPLFRGIFSDRVGFCCVIGRFSCVTLEDFHQLLDTFFGLERLWEVAFDGVLEVVCCLE